MSKNPCAEIKLNDEPYAYQAQVFTPRGHDGATGGAVYWSLGGRSNQQVDQDYPEAPEIVVQRACFMMSEHNKLVDDAILARCNLKILKRKKRRKEFKDDAERKLYTNTLMNVRWLEKRLKKLKWFFDRECREYVMQYGFNNHGYIVHLQTRKTNLSLRKMEEIAYNYAMEQTLLGVDVNGITQSYREEKAAEACQKKSS